MEEGVIIRLLLGEKIGISNLYDQIYLSEFDNSLSPLQLRRLLEKELPADSTGETLAGYSGSRKPPVRRNGNKLSEVWKPS